MNSKEQDTQQLIIDMAKELLEETEDVEKITVRQPYRFITHPHIKSNAQRVLCPIRNSATFYMYSGIDLSDQGQQSRFIDKLINNLIGSNEKSVEI